MIELPWLPAAPDDFIERCRTLQADATAGRGVQALAGARLSARQAAALSRAVNRLLRDGGVLHPLASFRLGVLSNATFDLLNDFIPASAARHGVALELVTAPYDQVMQQALDPSSDINAAGPDAVLLAVDHRWLGLDRPALEEPGGERVAAALGRLRSVVEALRASCGAPAILQTIPVPPAALFGNYDRRVRGTVRSMCEEANSRVVELAEQTGSYLLDVAALAERVGTDHWFDPVRWAAYKLPFAAEAFGLYADMLGRLVGAIRGKARKCLVLDLDNTIWGGVIGDDGLGGIQLGQGDAKGESFLAVQRAAADLRDRGVMLAVCSKNDDAVARAAFREHPEMVLRETHISAFQANWLDKPSNLEAIAKALNIGLDALVLLDDNPAERAQVRAALPEVAVPELPQDPSLYASFLSAAGYFEAVSFSAEDRLRAESYAKDAQRAEVMAQSRDLGDYLASLEMQMRLSSFDANGRQRVAQLINKTNQFNLTTRRYTEPEIAAMEADGAIFSLQARLSDRFGDLGMIGVVICRDLGQAASAWDIDTWLMSCRVLGRKVEEAMLASVVAARAAAGAARLIGTYLPTAKNGMVADHYRKLGFAQTSADPSGRSVWELDLAAWTAPALPMEVVEGSDRREAPADPAPADA